MPITNNDAIKYLIKQVVSNDGAGNVTLQPIWPQTVGSQILPETSYRVLGQNSFVLGGTYDAPGGTLSGNTTTVQVGSPTSAITLTLPSVSGTLATLDDVDAVVVSVSDGLFDLDNTSGVISVSPYAALTADATWVGTAGNAGKFYLGTVAPSGTTRLNYNGNLYATKLYSGGNEVLTAVSDAGLSTGEAITEITISNNEIVVTRDSFLHLGTSGSNIAQTVYGVKTFNSTISGSVSGNAGTVTTSADNSTNASRYILFADAVSGSQAPKTDTGLTYNPSTNTLTASVFSGDLDGNASSADQIKTQLTATGANFYLTFVDSNNSSATAETLYTEASLLYNPLAKLLTINGDLAVNGGDITTTSSSFNIGSTAATTHSTNIAGAATQDEAIKTINIGANGLSGSTTNVVIGSSNAGAINTVTIKGNLIVNGTTTTENVETVSTSNGVVFEGTVADDFELLLKAGSLSADQTVTLPDATGTVALTSDIKDATITISGGTDLETGGSFTLNQSGDATITIDHSDVTRTDPAAGTSNLASEGSFTVVTGITSSDTGHITAVATTQFTLPASDTYDISASAVTGGASLDLDASNGSDSAVEFLGSGGTTVTRTDSDTITISSTVVSDATITLTAGNGLVTGGSFSLNGDATTVTFDLGTPGTLSSTSTNAATADSHTHAISSGSLTNNSQGTITVGGTGKVLDSDITIQLAANYGDTVNPYASKTANYVLAAPSGSNGVPSFRALVNADLPNSGVASSFDDPVNDTSGTFSVVTVNKKGVVTAAYQNIQVGTYTTAQGPTNSTNQPAANLIAGGLFFEALEASDA